MLRLQNSFAAVFFISNEIAGRIEFFVEKMERKKSDVRIDFFIKVWYNVYNLMKNGELFPVFQIRKD